MKAKWYAVILMVLLSVAIFACGDDDDDNDDQADDDATDDDSGDDDTTDDDADDDVIDDDTYIGDDDDTFVGDWYIDTVDSMYGVMGEFMHSSIDLDSMDAPYISFFDMASPYGLRVASCQNNEWIIQRILNDSEFRGFASYELDDNDIGHLAIQQIITTPEKDTLKILSHATNKNGIWELEVISDDVDEDYLEVGNFASLAIYADNKLHLSCYGLLYFNNISGPWEFEGYDPCNLEASSGFFSSIIIDGDNEVHITHGGCDNIEYCQRYTTSVGGWHGECIPDTEDRTYQSSITVDQNGVINIAFNRLYETTKHEQIHSLYFALKSGDEWTTEEIDSNISAKCRELSDSYLGLDPDGNAHIAYTGLDDEDIPVLKYATNASGEWVTEIVDPSPNSGIGASIAVDGEGYVHISYYDNGNSSLKYATNRP